LSSESVSPIENNTGVNMKKANANHHIQKPQKNSQNNGEKKDDDTQTNLIRHSMDSREDPLDWFIDIFDPNVEVWKEIPEFSMYEVSSFGRIRHHQTMKIIKSSNPKDSKDPYVSLRNNNPSSYKKVKCDD
jgi:hypothetical protein